MSTRIELTFAEGTATLWLAPGEERRPPTLDTATLVALESAFKEVEQHSDVRLLWVRSRSTRFFCAGAHIDALARITAATIPDWIAQGHRVFNRLEDLPMPTVARVEGYALGGGLELALACDLIFASDAAQFGQPEGKLGFVAGWGGSWRLPRRVGVARAKELLFTGRMVPAQEAATLGLCEFQGSAAALDDQCAAFLASLSEGNAGSAIRHKRLVADAWHRSRDEAAAGEAAASVDCLQNADTQRRVAEFLGRRQAKGSG